MRAKWWLPPALWLMAGLAEGQELPRFADVDADGSRLISREEAQAYPRLARAFDEIDQNGDGRIDAAEYARWRMLQGS